MPIHVVRLGTPRHPDEGPRLGTVRYPPRGVPKADLAKRGYYDVWLPALAPSVELVRWFRDQPEGDSRWKRFAQRYRSEMKAPDRAQLLDLLALLSQRTDFAVGCYCEDESRCHRSLLAELLQSHGANLSQG